MVVRGRGNAWVWLIGVVVQLDKHSVMADFLGEYPELQPAGEELWGLRPTLESWEEDEEVVGHNRQSPVRRFSPLVERSEDEELTFSSSPVNVLEEYNGDDLLYTTVPDPIRLRGVGGTTMFGLNNHFQDEFPSHLVGKVSNPTNWVIHR